MEKLQDGLLPQIPSFEMTSGLLEQNIMQIESGKGQNKL